MIRSAGILWQGWFSYTTVLVWHPDSPGLIDTSCLDTIDCVDHTTLNLTLWTQAWYLIHLLSDGVRRPLPDSPRTTEVTGKIVTCYMKCSSQFPLDNVQKPRCICIVNTWHLSALDKFCRHICGNVCTHRWYSMDTISVCILYDKYIITNISYMRIFYIWICGTYNKTQFICLWCTYICD